MSIDINGLGTFEIIVYDAEEIKILESLKGRKFKKKTYTVKTYKGKNGFFACTVGAKVLKTKTCKNIKSALEEIKTIIEDKGVMPDE